MKVSPISTWTEVEKLYSKFRNSSKRWIFRGHRDAEWSLKPKLERALLDRFQRPLTETPEMEMRLLREFKRHLHRYTNDIPDQEDDIRWLALMQHHGAPTRLLDFTFSFFIAVFFAIEAAKPNDHCAIWAIDQDWLWKKAKSKLPSDLVLLLDDPMQSKTPDTNKKLFLTRKELIVTLNPMQLDERLAVQQGTFACGLDPTKSFSDQIKGLATSTKLFDEHVCKVEFICSLSFIKDAIHELQRMNITRLSLFPGIDGLAQSMENAIELPILNRFG